MMFSMRGISLFWFGVICFTAAFLLLFQSVLAPFVLGLAIAYLLNPLVLKLEKMGSPRWLAVLLLLFGFLLFMGLGVAFLVPVLLRELTQLADVLPQWMMSAQDALASLALRFGFNVPDFGSLVDSVQGQAGQLFKASKGFLGGVIAGGAAILSFVSFIFLMPIVAFYMMLDWPKLVQKFHDLLPRTKVTVVRDLTKEIDRTLAGFIRGQLSVCVILGLFYGVGLTAIGLKFGFVIGVGAGILSIMPYVGSGFGLVMSVAVAWFTTGDTTMVGMALIVFALGQFLEGNFLTPRMVGDNIGLHPLWVIFALMAGGSLLGFVGLLVAVPVAAVIGVMVRFALSEYRKSDYYAG